MKVDLKKTFLGFDKKTIIGRVSYAIAERVIEEGGKVSINPMYVGNDNTKGLAIETTGEATTLQSVLAEHLLFENKENKLAKAKLGYTILNCEDENMGFGETDIEMMKNILIEKETNGLILVQALKALE